MKVRATTVAGRCNFACEDEVASGRLNGVEAERQFVLGETPPANAMAFEFRSCSDAGFASSLKVAFGWYPVH